MIDDLNKLDEIEKKRREAQASLEKLAKEEDVICRRLIGLGNNDTLTAPNLARAIYMAISNSKS